MATAPVRLGAPKDSMEPRKVIPAGRYTVRLEGFKPKLSKAKPGTTQSVNFNPQLKVTNHPTLNGEKVFLALNENAGFIMEAFCHMLGHTMTDAGETLAMPGEWYPDANDPNDVSKYTYRGPLTGSVGELQLEQGTYNNKPSNYIKQFYCRVPGCKTEHPTELT